MKIKALSNIKHDQVNHREGEVFDVNYDAGKELVRVGVAVKASRDDQIVADARKKAGTKPPKTEKIVAGKPGEVFKANEGFKAGNSDYKKRTGDKGSIQYTANGREISKDEFDEAFKLYSKEQADADKE